VLKSKSKIKSKIKIKMTEQQCQFCNATSNVRQINLCNIISRTIGIFISGKPYIINTCKTCITDKYNEIACIMNKMVKEYNKYVENKNRNDLKLDIHYESRG
jgi:hypothetical protein